MSKLECSYKKTTDIEKLRFKNIISAIVDATLSMVENGVVVLPSDFSKNAKPSIYKHKEITTTDKQTAFQKYKYDNVMSLKDIFLECLPNKDNIFFLNKAIKNIKIVKVINGNNKKIKFVFHKNIINTIGLVEQHNLIKDVLYFEKVINCNNKRFTQLLPYAIMERKKIIQTIIKKTSVPYKAIHHENTNLPTDESL
ncbi:MAG: hypothetical protein IJT15_02820 [Rickettsiales bacterium]|nr:hypothetical protein [Rickettsiales bacterium]